MAFEQKTPFDIGTLTQAAKALLAVGTSASDIVPIMSTLTDISQGQATKLSTLVDVYTKVHAVQQVNGMDLRQLMDLGIPIYQDLETHFEKMGGAALDANGNLTTLTSTTVNNAKMTVAARQSMTDTLKYDQEQLAIDEQKTAKSTTAKESLALAEQRLTDKISEDTAKLGTHTVALGGVGAAAGITGEQIKAMVSNGQVSAKDFDEVLTEMTSKGGLFYQENIRQMATFSGIMSSTQSQIQYAILNLMGIDIGAANEIRKGGLFDSLKNLAADLLDWLHKLQPTLEAIGSNHTFQLAIQGFVVALGSLIIILPIVIAALNPIVLIVLAIEAVIVLLYMAWKTNFGGLRTITQDVISSIITFLQPFLDLYDLIFGKGDKVMKTSDMPLFTAFEGFLTFLETYVVPLIGDFTKFWKDNGQQIMTIVETVWSIVKTFIQIAIIAIGFIIQVTLAQILRFWKDHGAEVIEFLKGAWEIIEGVFQVALAIIDTVLVLFLALITGNWKNTYKQINSDMNEFFQGLENLWNGLVNVLKSIGSSILDALEAPFKQAFSDIQGIVKNIKNALDFTQRHSPSVLDVVQNGVALVNQALTGIQFQPNVSAQQIGTNIISSSGIANSRGAGVNLTIQLPNALIADSASAMRVSTLIGNNIIKQLQLNRRF